MIKLQSVSGNLISKRLTIFLTSTNGLKNEEVADRLFENIQFILNCTSYSFEDEDTLDHDFNIELTDDDDDCNRNDNSRDTDYNDECKNENIVRHQFSLEYMKNVVQFYY